MVLPTASNNMKCNFLHIVLFSMIFLAFSACYKDDHFLLENKNLNTLFSFSAGSDSIPADGYSTTPIIVSGLPIDIVDSNNLIKLTTSKSSFQGFSSDTIMLQTALVYDSTNALFDRVASVLLKSTLRVDSAFLTATMQGFSKSISVYFTRAYPDSMRIVSPAIYLTHSYTTVNSFEVDLFRNSGIPSLNDSVSFLITDTLNQPIGYYQKFSNLSDSSGKCYFGYIYNDSTYLGALKVKASVRGNQGALSDSINVYTY
jgi:hypothetical protein